MKTKIYIDDFIGAVSFMDEGISARMVRDQLAAADGDIEIRINSPGGSVFQGHEIYNAIRDYAGGAVDVVIDGVAGSIASVIAFAGDTLPQMRINSSMMIHNPSTITIGTAEEHRQSAQALDTVKKTIIAVYENAAPDSSNNFAELMDNETFFDTEAAIAAGLAIEHNDTPDNNVNNMQVEITAGMSFEDLLHSFAKAKAEAQVAAGLDPIVEQSVIADPPEDNSPEPETNFTAAAAKQRLAQILTDDARPE